MELKSILRISTIPKNKTIKRITIGDITNKYCRLRGPITVESNL